MNPDQGPKTGLPASIERHARAKAYAPGLTILIVAVAALLRLYSLGGHSFWYDEASSIGNARAISKLPPFEDWSFFDAVTRDRLPPLYFLFIIPFHCIGKSEWLLRLSSVIWGIAAIPLMYRFGSRLFSRRVGFIGALLLAFSPFHIHFSQVLRPYSLFLFLSILIFYLSYLALEENRNGHYIGLIAVCVLGVYTHTYALFPLFIANLYFILRWKAHRHLLHKWILTHVLMIVFCVPALYLVGYHILKGRIDLGSFSPLRSAFGTFYVFTLGRVFLPTRSNLIFIVIGLAINGIGLLVGVRALWREKAKSGTQPPALLLAAAITGLAIWLVSFRVALFDEAVAKYLIFFLPLYYLLIAKGWDYFSNRGLKTALISGAVLISLIAIYPYYFEWDRVGKGDFRAAAKYVQLNLKEDDIIVHTLHKSKRPFDFYFDWRVPQFLAAEVSNLDQKSPSRIWLVIHQAEAGLDVGMKSLSSRQIGAHEQQYDETSLCNDTASSRIRDEYFHLVNIKAYPGKNRLTICLYQKDNLTPSPKSGIRTSSPHDALVKAR